ncbi:uncharacterized protein LOC105843252 [Hydra vulgaris]|uniref:uncharacterized protein LOC105843252 n=1 Tax=Hydra vulgaris TaxID=6087 RepID=UPI000641452D|nr:uncharacterized protein LOC105843252 [Hydra vulgaris]
MLKRHYFFVFALIVVCIILFYTKDISVANRYFNIYKKRGNFDSQNHEAFYSTAKTFSSIYGDNSCKEQYDERHHLLTIFQKWIKLAKNYNITYFLTCGSLLGSWRNQDLIPYDRDLDILISNTSNIVLESIKDKRNFHESDNKFHLILQSDWRKPYSERRRFKCNGEQVKVYSDHCSFQEPLGRLIKGDFHLDIYDYSIRNGLVYDPSEWEKTYKAADVFPLTKCMFMGEETWCPKSPEVILSQLYKELSPNKICKNGEWFDVT